MFARKEQPAGNPPAATRSSRCASMSMVYRVVYLGKHARLD